MSTLSDSDKVRMSEPCIICADSSLCAPRVSVKIGRPSGPAFPGPPAPLALAGTARGVNVLGSGEKTLRARSYCFDTHFEKGLGLALLDSPGSAACIIAQSYTGEGDSIGDTGLLKVAV